MMLIISVHIDIAIRDFRVGYEGYYTGGRAASKRRLYQVTNYHTPMVF